MKFTTLKARLAMLFVVIGPGIIAANADNDAGGINTLTYVGAKYGYNIVFALVIATIVLGITQEIGARIGVVSGKGLGGIIRERYGLRVTLFAAFIMLIANIGVLVANVAGAVEAFSLFGMPKIFAVVIFLGALFVILYRGSFEKAEKIFLGLSLLYIVYVVSALVVMPPATEVVKRSLFPDIPKTKEFLFAVMALIGTTITPWGQFFIQSYVVDKGIHIKNLLLERIEIVVGAVITGGIGFFIVASSASTLFEDGIIVESATEAAKALEPIAGQAARILFGIGLLNASLLGAAIVALATGYALCEVFGFESGIDNDPKDAKVFYWVLGVLLVFSSLFVLIPGLPLFVVILSSQYLNALLLPVILIFVFQIANDTAIMGRYKNSMGLNIVGGLTIGLLLIASLFVMAGYFLL